MLRTRIAKALLVPAIVIPVTAGALAFAGTASAAGPSVKPAGDFPVKCTSLSGTVGGTGTVSGCKGNGTATSGTFPTNGSSPVTVDWSNGTTTTTTFSYTGGSGKDCPGSGTEEVVTGTTTGGTDTSIPSGLKLKGDICVSGTLQLSLYPGTKFKV
jgi:hypothetical protein